MRGTVFEVVLNFRAGGPAFGLDFTWVADPLNFKGPCLEKVHTTFHYSLN
jgi:hypothetical protein